jgi:hypothetical protein
VTGRERSRWEFGFFLLGLALIAATFDAPSTLPPPLRVFCLAGGAVTCLVALASWADRSHNVASDRRIRDCPGFYRPPTSGTTVHARHRPPVRRALIRPSRSNDRPAA